MAQLGGTFDASQVDPNQPHETLPPGDYRVQIIASEMRVTKAGNGQYLWLEMDVLDGAMAGKKLFDRLNLVNPNRQAEEIAQRTLSAICHAVGRMQVADSEELHFKPMVVKVMVDKEGYNQIKGYKAVSNTPTASGHGFQSQTNRYAAQQTQPAQHQPQPATQQPAAQQPTQYQSQPAAQQPVQQAAQPQPTDQVPNQVPTAPGLGPWRRMS
jgi:hypothetical protein